MGIKRLDIGSGGKGQTGQKKLSPVISDVEAAGALDFTAYAVKKEPARHRSVMQRRKMNAMGITPVWRA
jgi:hypothetical protein